MPPTPTLTVTVAIPTYNRADFLRQTLAGLVTQQFPRDHFEILVLDNNSTDHTRAVVAEFASAHPAPRYLLETHQVHARLCQLRFDVALKLRHHLLAVELQRRGGGGRRCAEGAEG